jgi:Immunity protein 53
MTILTALQNRFQRQCNREWERTYGVTIQIADNPGWWVTIDQRGTPLEHTAFEPVMRGDFASGDPQPPWLHCRVKDAVFHGAGDLERLDEILGVFLAWCKRE